MRRIINRRETPKPVQRIRLAIFDMDGTIFESHLNWLNIREELQIPPGGNILKEIYKGDRVDHRRLEILEKYENENTLKTVPINGIPGFLVALKTGKVTTFLLTNNNRQNTFFLLEKYRLEFDLVITREMKLWKPDPDGFFYVMNRFMIDPGETVSIGDSPYDVEASRLAGIPHIFMIKTPRTRQMEAPDITLFDDYVDLKTIMKERGMI